MKYLFLILLLVIQIPSFASGQDCSFIPKNDLKIPIGAKNDGLTEEEYNSVIDKVEKIYSPIIRQNGGRLQINRLWQSPTVNAGTYRNEDRWIINLYGGYARHPAITLDGYALVLCHEIGHHIGGAPKKTGADWSSTEGQADYFATLKCLRKVFAKDDNLAAIEGEEVPAVISENCAKAFSTDWEEALCIRTTLAGLSPGNISADIRGSLPPSIDTPASTNVLTVFEGHPEPQCRLDTYFQGSICEVSSYQTLSQTDESQGTCYSKNGQVSGLRPACWFIEKWAIQENPAGPNKKGQENLAF